MILRVDYDTDRDNEMFCQGECKKLCGREAFKFGKGELRGRKIRGVRLTGRQL